MTIREELYQEINDTRAAYFELLKRIPEAAYCQPSGNPAWTVGEVLYHISLAPRLLNRDVKMIVEQNRLMLLPRLVPRRLFNWLNETLTRYGARHVSREFLAAEYEKAHQAALKALAGVKEEDFGKSLIYPDWDVLLCGEVTLERLFRYVKVHFESHAAQLAGATDRTGDESG